MRLAVILDMDGLMLDTEAVSGRVWRQTAVDLGVAWSDAIARAMVGRPEAATRELLRAHFGDVAPTLAARAQAQYRAVLETDGVPRKPGLDALVDWLVREDIPRAVATSTERRLAEFKLTAIGIRTCFDVVVCGDEVARGKPAPDIFLEAAARLRRDPATCIVLEDSEPGILAAAAARMRAVLIPDRCEPSDAARETAWAVVDSLASALGLLQRLHVGQQRPNPVGN